MSGAVVWFTAFAHEAAIDQQPRSERKRVGERVPIAIDRAAGPAPDVIVDAAAREKFDLIVIGTHGRRGFRRLVMGSVAEQVLRAAPTPVVVVRERAGAAS